MPCPLVYAFIESSHFFEKKHAKMFGLILYNLCLLQVAQTRLENRTYRPNVELCRDQPQYQLCHEVAEISGSIRALTEKLRESENSLQALRSNLSRINEDLAVKNNSIALEGRCMSVREKMREVPHSMTDMHPMGQPIGNTQYTTTMNSLGQYTTTTRDTTSPKMVLPPQTGGHFNPPTRQYTLPTGYTGSLRAAPEPTKKYTATPIAE